MRSRRRWWKTPSPLPPTSRRPTCRRPSPRRIRSRCSPAATPSASSAAAGGGLSVTFIPKKINNPYFDAAKEGADKARVDGKIELLDISGSAIATYQFKQGWPIKYVAATLDASTNNVALEELQICHEGFERV